MRIITLHLVGILFAWCFICAHAWARTDDDTTLAIQTADSIPPVPEAIVGQRTSYGSPNLLPGDSSFELPSGDYLYGISPSGAPVSEASLTPIRPNCTATVGVHGTHALRVSRLQPNGTHVVCWSAVPLVPEHNYTFSIYLRSSSPDTVVRMICPPYLPETRATPLRTRDQWQRHSVTFRVPETQDRLSSAVCSPMIVVSTDALSQATPASPEWRVELDAAQFEDATSPSPYRPHQAIDYTAILPRTLPFDHALAGQPLKLLCASRNNSSAVLRLQFVWQLTDVLSRSARIRTVETTLQPGRRFSCQPDFDPIAPGYYLLTTYIRGGLDAGHIDHRELSALNPLPDNNHTPPAFFGRINPIGLLDARPTPRSSVYEKLTARWPRVCITSWAAVEFAPGRYDVAPLMASVSRVTSNNATPIIYLGDGYPWPPLRPARQTASGETLDPAKLPQWSVLPNSPTSTLDARQYRQFVFRTVLQMSSNVRYWIPPEPADGRPTDLNIEFIRAARLADPNLTVVHRRLSPTRPTPTTSLPSSTTLPSADSDVLMHTVWTPGPDDPMPDTLELDRRLAALARDATGQPTPPARWEATPVRHWPRTKDPAVRAIMIHRMTLLLKKHGVSQWLIPDPPEDGTPIRLGPPIEVTTLACMADWLPPAQFRREVSIDKTISLLEYECPLGRFAAAFLPSPSKGSPPHSLLIPAGIRMTNLFAVPLTDGTEATTIEPAIAPVYLWPVQPDTHWLDELVQRNRPHPPG